MPIAFVECPNCHFKFNYNFTRGLSMHASLSGGNSRAFFCPNCQIRQVFDLSSRKENKSFPTYDDRPNLWEITLLIGPVVPLFAMSLVDVSYGFDIFSLPTIIGSAGGIVAWMLAYSVYSGLKTPLRGTHNPLRR